MIATAYRIIRHLIRPVVRDRSQDAIVRWAQLADALGRTTDRPGAVIAKTEGEAVAAATTAPGPHPCLCAVCIIRRKATT